MFYSLAGCGNIGDMVAAVREFDRIQIGRESRYGTGVPARAAVIGDGTVTEEREYYRDEYPAGVLATVGGAGVVTRQGAMIELDMSLSAEEILWPLLSGIRKVKPVSGVWTFEPQLHLATKDLSSLAIEVSRGSGDRYLYANRFLYGLTNSFDIGMNTGERATMSWNLFARPAEAHAITKGIGPVTGQETLISDKTSITVDDSWANLGTSKVLAFVRSASLEVTTGLARDYTLSGRDDRSYSNYLVSGPLMATLSMTLEYDAEAAKEAWCEFRDNNLRFVRLSITGTGGRSVVIDGCYRFSEPPSESLDESTRLIDITLDMTYDAVSRNAIKFVVTNSITDSQI